MSDFVKHDAGKLRFDLIDPAFEVELAEILTHGAVKYAANNWQRASPVQARDRYYAALRRHLAAWYAGEELDPDSGLPHLSSVAFCTMALRWFDRQTGQMRAYVEQRVLDYLSTEARLSYAEKKAIEAELDAEDAAVEDDISRSGYRPHMPAVGLRPDDVK